MKKNLTIFMTMLLLTSIGYSQAPGIFNYQGVARNSVGNVLVNKTITLRLTIHDATAAGPVVYQESRTVITNPFGLFNVQVGSPGGSNVTGTIAGVPWGAGGAKFIQVEIDPNGGTTFINIGTAQIASVPYALFATTAGEMVLPFIKTQSEAGSTLIGLTNSATTGTGGAFQGTTASTDNNAYAITGTISSTSPGGGSAAIRGINNGTGINGYGVYGSHAGAGTGVHGFTFSGTGVFGQALSGTAVHAFSQSGYANVGRTIDGAAAFFEIAGPANVNDAVTMMNAGSGLTLRSSNSGTGGAGLFALIDPVNTSNALRATTNGTGHAILGVSSSLSSTNAGVRGETISTAANANAVAGVVSSTNPGVFSTAVRGINNGTGANGIGVFGSQAGSGIGVYGFTPGGTGVRGASNDGNAATFEVLNNTSLADVVQIGGVGKGKGLHVSLSNGESNGILSTLNLSPAVHISTRASIYGESVDAIGVVGLSTNQSGVYGYSSGNLGGTTGVNTGDGYGIWGVSTGVNGSAGRFEAQEPNNIVDAVSVVQKGFGNGIFSDITNSSGTSDAIAGQTKGNGAAISGKTIGLGNAAIFETSSPANNGSTVKINSNGEGMGLEMRLTNAASGQLGILVDNAGTGHGIRTFTHTGFGVWSITDGQTSAALVGDNPDGDAVIGRSSGTGASAVAGRMDGGGFGVKGFVAGPTPGNAPPNYESIGVYAEAGISLNTGIAFRARNLNAANTSDVMQVYNANGATGNMIVFRSGPNNVARIDATGHLFANGGLTAGGADIAEYFSVEGDRESYEAGDVLAISEHSDRKIERSSTPYSNLVSGVYATKPGLMLTEADATNGDLKKMVPMGVIGVLPTKVCLEGGAIKRGDLLVTSSIPGVAMKADRNKVELGQVLGKALEGYDGTSVGKINVLVSVK